MNRRQFVISSGAAVLAAAIAIPFLGHHHGGGKAERFADARRALEAYAQRNRRELAELLRIGKAYADMAPDEADLTRLTERLLVNVANKAHPVTVGEIEALLGFEIDMDFSVGRVHLVENWYLCATEARICLAMWLLFKT